MQLILIIEQVLNGLLIGACTLLIALGVALIFSLGGIVNLAHGAFYAIGAYLAVRLSARIGFPGAFVAAPIMAALLGIVSERFLFRRFYRADPVLSLLLTFGLAMVAEQGLRMIFGASPIPYAMPEFLRGQLSLGDFVYPRNRLVMLAVATVAVTLTWLLLYRTPFGRVVRAGMQNPEIVGALGISLPPYTMAIAALGGGLAGLAGALHTSIAAIHPAMGQEILAAAFVVLVIGGLGSFWGVVGASLLVGVVRGLAAYVDPSWSEASMIALMVLVLVFRPRGLFGERITTFE